MHSQEKTKTFLLTKNEYKKFESSGTLIDEAIKNAFGEKNKQNQYTLDIKQVDAWNDATAQFKYFPETANDTKKAGFSSAITSAKENTSITFCVTLNPVKSEVNSFIKPYLSKKNTFNLNIVVIADERILVKETKTKSDFLSLIDEHAFADRSFKTFFGEPRKMNYSIAYDKVSACFIRSVTEPKCTEKIELMASDDEYRKFNNKITSAECSSTYVLFDVKLARDRSTFNPQIESTLFKKKDGSEHLKFYYVIPKDNIRANQKRVLDIEGKIVNKDKQPQKDINVYLKNNANATVASQKTEENGVFKFDKLKEGEDYSLLIDAASSSESTLFVATKNVKVIGQFDKKPTGFEYKLLDADLVILSNVEEADPSLEYTATLKGKMVKVNEKISPLSRQTIELKNNSGQVLQSQTTDELGNFEFIALSKNGYYTIELPNYMAEKNEKIYLANSKNELVKQFIKNDKNKFEFKILPIEVSQLQSMNDNDVELSFSKQKSFNQNEIIIRDFVYYSLNSFQITPESKSTIDKIAKLAEDNANFNLEIISHTDSRGEDTENQKLSEKRSESVIAYLVSKKIDPKRLKPVGMGESQPLNACNDGTPCIEDEFKMNRRTEFKFYK